MKSTEGFLQEGVSSPRDQEGTPSIPSQPQGTRQVRACVLCVRVFSVLNRPQLCRRTSPHRSRTPHLGWKLIEGWEVTSVRWCWAQTHGHSVQVPPELCAEWLSLFSRHLVLSHLLFLIMFITIQRIIFLGQRPNALSQIYRDFSLAETSETF